MNNKLKIKFKEGVYGFIFDSQYGEITDIITEPVTEQEQATFHKYSGDTLMFIDIETIQEVFSLEFEEDKDKVDSEFWNNVLEVVEENKIKPIEQLQDLLQRASYVCGQNIDKAENIDLHDMMETLDKMVYKLIEIVDFEVYNKD